MRREPISLRRRHLMAAGLAGIAAPVTVLSAPSTSPRAALPTAQLVISGRILGADRKPLAGATIEAWDPERNGAHVTVITDGDGRFFAAVPDVRRGLDYRIGHQTLGTLPARRLQLTRGGGGDNIAQLHRDEAGVWRASFGITLA